MLNNDYCCYDCVWYDFFSYKCNNQDANERYHMTQIFPDDLSCLYFKKDIYFYLKRKEEKK